MAENELWIFSTAFSILLMTVRARAVQLPLKLAAFFAYCLIFMFSLWRVPVDTISSSCSATMCNEIVECSSRKRKGNRHTERVEFAAQSAQPVLSAVCCRLFVPIASAVQQVSILGCRSEIFRPLCLVDISGSALRVAAR